MKWIWRACISKVLSFALRMWVSMPFQAFPKFFPCLVCESGSSKSQVECVVWTRIHKKHTRTNKTGACRFQAHSFQARMQMRHSIRIHGKYTKASIPQRMVKIVCMWINESIEWVSRWCWWWWWWWRWWRYGYVILVIGCVLSSRNQILIQCVVRICIRTAEIVSNLLRF